MRDHESERYMRLYLLCEAGITIPETFEPRALEAIMIIQNEKDKSEAEYKKALINKGLRL